MEKQESKDRPQMMEDKDGPSQLIDGKKDRKAEIVKAREEKQKEIQKKIDEKQAEKIRPQWKIQIENFLDHPATQSIMGIITIYALFGDDTRTLVTDKNGDPKFWIANCVAMGLFSVELLLSSISKLNYFNGFFFWLDFISTLSLLLDIGWFTNAIFGTGGGNSAASAAALARAGRASRVGTRAGRIVRIVRLIRLIKMYKLAQNAIQNEAKEMENLEKELNMAQGVDDKPNEAEKNVKNEPQVEPNSTLNKQKELGGNGFAGLGFSHTNGQSSAPGGDRQAGEPSFGTLPGGAAGGSKQASGEQEQMRKIKGAQRLEPLNIATDNHNVLILSGGINSLQSGVEGPSKPISKFEKDPLINQTDPLAGARSKGDSMNNAKEIIQINRGRETSPEGQQATSNAQLQKQTTTVDGSKDKKVEPPPDDSVPVFKETVLGKKLSDLTIQKVITLVLSVMLSIPLFDLSTYQDAVSSYGNGLGTIIEFTSNTVFLNTSFQNYLSYHSSVRDPVVYVKFYATSGVTDPCCAVYPSQYFDYTGGVDYNNLRTEDQVIYTYQDDTGTIQSYSIVDIHTDNRLDAILSITRTIFVSIVLSAGAMLFSSDVENLVVSPIEEMLKKVQRISENPLEAAQIEEREAIALEKLVAGGFTEELDRQKQNEKMETSILERLIIKTGALLAVGFGEAGAKIIAENMSKGGDVDPMLPGKKMMAIFGFCDIHYFLDATEVLQTGVMLFVNEVAEITHGTVDQYCGQTNKNIGDAFLLVWKFGENDYSLEEDGHMKVKDEPHIHEFSDLPVVAFIKIICGTNMSNKLHKYEHHEGLKKRMPNFHVKMGFGLHQGWAIEGAIGSQFKIDASYLSPNVNMASRLEAATKQFGTQTLISGPLYKLLTPACQQQLRHIDTVTVKGSLLPLEFYTCDISVENMMKKCKKIDRFDNTNLSRGQRKKKRVLERIKRNSLRTDILEGRRHIADLFKTDRELLMLREPYTKEFGEVWKVGFDHYIKGNWAEAIKVFQQTLNMLPGIKDGPSKTLIAVIEDAGGHAPSTWKNYRVLTDK